LYNAQDALDILTDAGVEVVSLWRCLYGAVPKKYNLRHSGAHNF
jgi:hypothetical protein